jgi:hypothetical protein
MPFQRLGLRATPPRIRPRHRAVALPISVLVLALLVAGPALAYKHTVRWIHPDPSQVSGFIIHVGDGPGEYSQKIMVGLPQPDSNGIYEWTIDLPPDGASYLAVTAIGRSGLRSKKSNVRKVKRDADARLGRPGEPFVVSP